MRSNSIRHWPFEIRQHNTNSCDQLKVEMELLNLIKLKQNFKKWRKMLLFELDLNLTRDSVRVFSDTCV